MSVWVRSRHKPKAKRRSANLHLESLEARNLLSTDLGAAALALVPDAAVTAQAIRGGNWSDPNTWQNGVVPAANANVLIPTQISVTVDGATNSVHWVRVDGTLQFSATADTNLLVDTLVVTMNGSLVIGTAANPIPAQHHASITFTSNGPIDTTWDPNLLSRGLVAMGTVTMFGAATTPYVTLAQNAAQGATTLTLSNAPTNWQVGDEIVLGGTFTKWNQDEDLHILGIQGNQVTVSALAYAHTSSNGVPVYLTDLTRNIVVQSQDPSVIGHRGHALLMCSDMTNIHYAEFLGLDRTDKSRPVNDPQLDTNGNLIPGTGTNPRDRYALDIWDGDDVNQTAGVVDGSTVVGSPGWGFVNHSSNVNYTNDVAFNVNGTAFISEAGNEIGSFMNDLAIHSLGTGAEDFYDPSRVPIQDWAHEGDGFWMQGNGVTVQNNVAIGLAAAGFYYFIKPYTLPLQNVPPSNAPLTGFTNNLAESCDYGAFLRYENNGGTVNAFTAHNCLTGFKEQYSQGITLQNSFLYGSSYSDYGIFLPVESAQNFVANNDTVTGYPVGIRFSEEYHQTLIGGTWNNQQNIEIPNSVLSGRSITISNPTFAPSSDPLHYDVFWLNEFDAVRMRNVGAFFGKDTVLYNGHQLYPPWQGAGVIPFPQQASQAPYYPTALLGLTNSQLQSQYGLALGEAISPTPLSGGPITNGTMGTPAVYPTTVYLDSPPHTNQLTGYQLVYQVGSGPQVTVPTPFNLSPGWNMLVTTINGSPWTFFVYGDSGSSGGSGGGSSITGPAGYGPNALIGPGQVMTYTISFQNPPTSTATVRAMTITQQLDPNLNWVSFAFGNIAFGNSSSVSVPPGTQSVSTTVQTTNPDGTPLNVVITGTLNTQTGVVTWTFQSIDPSTGQPPLGPGDGFLPVDDGTGRGAGTVRYTIRTQSNAATGTVIQAAASIGFDSDAPFLTNSVSNMIDASPPTSTVMPLAAVTYSRAFLVTWSGSDNPGGSGIAGYNVYVSVDGGSYTLFQSNSSMTAATFLGDFGHSYRFYSVATDHTGNAQPTPPGAQAGTAVRAPSPPTNLAAVANTFTHSPEYYTDFVAAAYQRYLGRAPDGPGLTGWVSLMEHGLSDERLEACFLGSVEYISHHGGTAQGWITGMYQDLLQRTPSAGEVAAWVNVIAGGTMTAVDIAYGFAASRERETMRIANDYATYLGRGASQAEIAAWVNAFIQGYSNENLIAGFVSSPEYYLSPSRGNANNTGWLLSVYHDVLHRTPAQQELDNWLTVLQ